MIKFSWAVQFEDIDGYVLLDGEDAEKKARECWKNTLKDAPPKSQFAMFKGKKIDEIIELSEEMFLGMLTYKGGVTLGVLCYKTSATQIKNTDFIRALQRLAGVYQMEE